MGALPAAGWLAWAWRRRLTARPPGLLAWWLLLGADAVLFGGLLGLLAIAASLLIGGRPSLFAVARFLCQGLFGEGVTLAAMVAALHLRRGLRARAAVPALAA